MAEMCLLNEHSLFGWPICEAKCSSSRLVGTAHLSLPPLLLLSYHCQDWKRKGGQVRRGQVVGRGVLSYNTGE